MHIVGAQITRKRTATPNAQQQRQHTPSHCVTRERLERSVENKRTENALDSDRCLYGSYEIGYPSGLGLKADRSKGFRFSSKLQSRTCLSVMRCLTMSFSVSGSTQRIHRWSVCYRP